MTRILVTGREGQVGWELRRTLATLGEVVALDRAGLDLSDVDALRRTVRDVAPAIIVNAAAHTAVDKAESEPDLARAINATAPGVLAEEARRLGALLVHYSTDYVFDGTKRTPYREDDACNPLGEYGRSKLAGERAIAEVGGDYLVFRTSWVFGARGKNFLLTMRRLSRERPELRVVADQFGAPTWSRAIAEATGQILAVRARMDQTPSGIYHMTCAGETTWCGFTEAIVERLLPEAERPRVTPITTADYPLPAPRPAYSVMSNDKLARTFGVRLPDWRAALDLCSEELKLYV